MNLINIYLIFTFYIIDIKNVKAARNYDVIFNKVRCLEMNTKYFSGWECSKTFRNRTTEAFTVIVNLTQDTVLDDLFARTVLYYKYKDYKKFLIDQLEDVCGLINGTAIAPFVKILWNEISTHGTINHNCPFLPDEGVVIKDMRFQSDYFPPDMPSGNWRLDITIFSKTYTKTLEKLGTLETYFITKSKSAGIRR